MDRAVQLVAALRLAEALRQIRPLPLDEMMQANADHGEDCGCEEQHHVPAEALLDYAAVLAAAKGLQGADATNRLNYAERVRQQESGQ